MPEANIRIANAAWRAARRELAVPTKPFFCLALCRIIVESALYGGRREFYGRFLKAETSMRTGKHVGNARNDPWAADIEASMKLLNLAVPLAERQAGDLIFNWDAARPYGHVGIFLDRDTIIENIRPEYRRHSISLPSYLALTPLEHFRRSLIARLPMP
jgi:hypothetical protein